MLSNPIGDAARGRPLMNDIPESVPWILFTLVVAALGVIYGDFSAKDASKPAAPPALLEARIVTEGGDKNHRHLPFTVYVLTQQLSWRLESADDLEGGRTLLSPALTVAINDAPEVFCVGTASFEGSTHAEEARAGRRAAKLAQWVGTAISNPHTRVFTLNAGQYKGTREPAALSQRRAIVLITGPHDKAVDFGEALRSGLERIRQTSPVVEDLLCHYSRSNMWLKLSKDAAEEIGRDR